MFRSHRLHIYVNGTWFHYVLLDEHIFERHRDITENAVLRLVMQLHLTEHPVESMDNKGFRYYVTDNLLVAGEPHKLIWLIPPDMSYVGVRTAYRRKSNGHQKI